jgi:hypothetical protein
LDAGVFLPHLLLVWTRSDGGLDPRKTETITALQANFFVVLSLVQGDTYGLSKTICCCEKSLGHDLEEKSRKSCKKQSICCCEKSLGHNPEEKSRKKQKD